MKLIDQSYKVIDYPENILQKIEKIARTCYQSEEKIKPGSDEKLVKSLIKRGHHSMLEFGDITVRFITNRGVTHELVRHRLCSFAQESTRYVRYDGDMEFIKPVWWPKDEIMYRPSHIRFIKYLEYVEATYKFLLTGDWQLQQAREVLPNALKTEIVVKANIREWRHIFSLRCSKAAHPQMREIMQRLLEDLRTRIPLVFD